MPVIKRYPNRKLYDTDAKRYITLDGIADLIREGAEVQVIDHTTEEDLTAVTLSQIIFEQEKKKGGFLPKSVLTGLVRASGDTFSALRRSLLSPLELFYQVDAEIEHRLQTLINRGDLAKEEAMRIRDKLLSHSARATDAVLPDENALENLLSKHSVPTRSEIEALHAQLNTLTEKLEKLIEEQRVTQK